jgi:hypothetical protein
MPSTILREWHVSRLSRWCPEASEAIMRAAVLLLALAAGISTAAVSQTVVADIHVGDGPVQGRIVIGRPYYPYAAPIVVHRSHPAHQVYRPVVVRHPSHGIGRGYHRVFLWYHPVTGRYYDHAYAGLHGLRRVSVREHEGRYWHDR